MGTLVVQTFLSLDGVMQSPGQHEDDREGGFELGGWLPPFMDDEVWREVVELHGRADALVLGRKTYEPMAAYWPTVTDAENPAATTMNGVAKYVASRTLDTVEWHNSTLLRGDLAARITAVKHRHDREIQVLGSGELVQTLLRHDLVDEFRLMVFPILLGRGKRLFADGTRPATFSLVGTSMFGNGVVLHSYRRARSTPQQTVSDPT